MGILRLLLAVSVLLFHTGSLFNYHILNEYLAVYSFFVISGFYMALILDRKYKNTSIKIFWGNRLLRIFPLYWIILATILVFTLLKFIFHIGSPDNAINHYLQYSQDTSPFLFILNLLNFIARNISLIFTTDYFLKSDNTGGYLLVQQAWTLQIELLFYLLAPFIIRLSQKVFISFVLLYISVFYLLIVPFNLLPPYTLTYAFCSNLIFFLLGISSYKLIFKKIEKNLPSKQLTTFITFSFIAFLLLYNLLSFKLIPTIFGISDPFYYLFLVISLPFIFTISSTNKVDNFIGSLAYPLYIIHFFIIKMLSNVLFFSAGSTHTTITVIVLTLVLSILIVQYIDKPIDKFRQRRLAAHSQD